MNLVDILLLLVLVASVWAGFQRGFLAGVLELLAWALSLSIAWAAYPYVAGWLKGVIPSVGVWAQPLSFVALLLVVRGVSSFGIRRALARWSDFDRQPVNRALGMLPGLVNGAVYAILIAGLLLTVPISDKLSAASQNSRIAGMLAGEAEWANRRLAPIFDEAIRNSMTTVGTEVRPNETVALHFKVASPKPRPDLESRMLELVNEERAQQGLPALKPDPEMTAVARAHARDMFARGYFSHYTPERKDPFDRMQASGVRFLTAGENLALGQTLQICHRGLMNSPGHRANILHASFGRLGIGVLDGGLYGLMIAQEFRN
ncbi:CvpA family protein [Flaviaesturariibacter aridisoli]|uniref:SCP domain-containing protein n=1 Tax=Flaviaesturariibacter aridisoli TaxID=2545761 RepID=A0A4R4DQ94_9BACT|nr:CvpA family protein [Flaviaesturariibacter aridisoli]TCZ64188.1 hypothetical protein E0486_18295 [Flaviaesturariibacter aridisoli]